jgi:GTPase SAR1 family protein
MNLYKGAVAPLNKLSDLSEAVACYLAYTTQYSTYNGRYLNEISVDENGIFELTSKDTPLFSYLQKLSEILGITSFKFSNTQYILDTKVIPFSCYLFNSVDRNFFRGSAFKMYLSHTCYQKWGYTYNVTEPKVFLGDIEKKTVVDNIRFNIDTLNEHISFYSRRNNSVKVIQLQECLKFLISISNELNLDYSETVKKYSFILDAIYNLPYTSTDPELMLHYLKLVFYLTSKRQPFDFHRFIPFASLLQKEPLAFSDITILVQNLKKTFPKYNDQLFIHFYSKKLIPISVITAAGVSTPKKVKITNNTNTVYRLIVFGESGSGKSTFINSIYNLLSYDSADKAWTSDLKTAIPWKSEYFDNVTKTFKPLVFGTTGFEDQNFGASQTQVCKTFRFTGPDGKIFEIIDTPGLNDTRSKEQDKLNFDHTVCYLSNVGYIHMAVFIINATLPRDTGYLGQYLRKLPPFIKDNTAFVFTFAESSMDLTRKLNNMNIPESYRSSKNIFGFNSFFMIQKSIPSTAFCKDNGLFLDTPEELFKIYFQFCQDSFEKLLIILQKIIPIKTKLLQFTMSYENNINEYQDMISEDITVKSALKRLAKTFVPTKGLKHLIFKPDTKVTYKYIYSEITNQNKCETPEIVVEFTTTKILQPLQNIEYISDLQLMYNDPFYQQCKSFLHPRLLNYF